MGLNITRKTEARANTSRTTSRICRAKQYWCDVWGVSIEDNLADVSGGVQFGISLAAGVKPWLIVNIYMTDAREMAYSARMEFTYTKKNMSDTYMNYNAKTLTSRHWKRYGNVDKGVGECQILEQKRRRISVTNECGVTDTHQNDDKKWGET